MLHVTSFHSHKDSIFNLSHEPTIKAAVKASKTVEDALEMGTLGAALQTLHALLATEVKNKIPVVADEDWRRQPTPPHPTRPHQPYPWPHPTLACPTPPQPRGPTPPNFNPTPS